MGVPPFSGWPAALRSPPRGGLTFDHFTSEPFEVIDASEDNVIAVTRISGQAKLSGVETDLTYAALYTFRDGKIAPGPRALDTR
jgi:ketosteroid isomerase-like protein